MKTIEKLRRYYYLHEKIHSPIDTPVVALKDDVLERQELKQLAEELSDIVLGISQICKVHDAINQGVDKRNIRDMLKSVILNLTYNLYCRG